MKKAVSILLIVCLAIMLPLTAFADGASATYKDSSYTWKGQKVAKPVFSGAGAAAMNEVMYDTYREFQFIGQRATNFASKPGITIDYTVYYNDNGLLSMSVNEEIASVANSAYPSEFKYFILFDAATGGVYHWDDLFIDDSSWKEDLLGVFNALLAAVEEDVVLETLPTLDAFYVDDENLVAIYAPGGLESGTSYEFTIPLGALVDVLNPATPLKAIADAAPVPEAAEETEEDAKIPTIYIPVGGVIVFSPEDFKLTPVFYFPTNESGTYYTFSGAVIFGE